MIQEGINFADSDFEYVINLLRKSNTKIGLFEDAIINSEFSFSVKLSNGKLIIPIEIMQDRLTLNENHETLRIIAESFMPDVLSVSIKEPQVIEIGKRVKTKSRSHKKLYILLAILFLFIITAILITLFYKTKYEKGLSLLKDKKYDLALIEFQKIDSLNDNYKNSLSKINYINGLIAYKDKEFEKSLEYFKDVDLNDELYSETKLMLDNLEKNPVVVYNAGLRYLNDKSYKKALIEFQKIKNTDVNYTNALNKINYIRALELIEEDNYENAEEYLKGYDSNDEYYDEVKLLQTKISSFRNNQANKEYAKVLINLANNIQDQWDHPPNNYPDFIQHLVWLRSSVNSSVNNARKFDINLKNLKESMIQWVNNYIKRSENGFEYRKQILRSYGYVSDNLIQNNFGDEIARNREAGNRLHSQVIKDINKLKSDYELN